MIITKEYTHKTQKRGFNASPPTRTGTGTSILVYHSLLPQEREVVVQVAPDKYNPTLVPTTPNCKHTRHRILKPLTPRSPRN